MKLIKDLDAKAKKLDYEKQAADDPRTVERCEYTMRIYTVLREQLEQLAPNIEQLKGLVKGFQLAQTIVGQHKELFKKEYEAERLTKDDFREKCAVVDACIESLTGAYQDRKEELYRSAGKADGVYSSAIQALEHVEKYLLNLEQQRRFMDDNPTFADKSNGEPQKEVSA
jgi:hypothetical protein